MLQKKAVSVLIVVSLVFLSGLLWVGITYTTRGGAPTSQSREASTSLPLPGQKVSGNTPREFAPLSDADDAVLKKIREKALGASDPKLLGSYKQEVTVMVGPAATTPTPAGQQQAVVQPRAFAMSVACVYPSKSIIWMHDSNQSIFSIVDNENGWKVTRATSLQKPLVADMAKNFVSAQREDLLNSIQGLLYLMATQAPDIKNASLKREPGYWVLRTNFEQTTCDYYFSENSLLCEKLVKQSSKFQLTVAYSDYKSEQGILLPHRLEMVLPDGKNFGTHIIAKWELGKVWPENLFTATGVKEF